MDKALQEIIRQSTFELREGRFVYVKTKHPPTGGEHFMVTRDADEITVVTHEENLGTLDVIERNRDVYALIALNVAVPFYSIGFLAAVSEAIARAGMNILVVSTYSKDYIMVRADLAGRVKDVLLLLGFQEKRR